MDTRHTDPFIFINRCCRIAINAAIIGIWGWIKLIKINKEKTTRYIRCSFWFYENWNPHTTYEQALCVCDYFLSKKWFFWNETKTNTWNDATQFIAVAILLRLADMSFDVYMKLDLFPILTRPTKRLTQKNVSQLVCVHCMKNLMVKNNVQNISDAKEGIRVTNHHRTTVCVCFATICRVFFHFIWIGFGLLCTVWLLFILGYSVCYTLVSTIINCCFFVYDSTRKGSLCECDELDLFFFSEQTPFYTCYASVNSMCLSLFCNRIYVHSVWNLMPMYNWENNASKCVKFVEIQYRLTYSTQWL